MQVGGAEACAIGSAQQDRADRAILEPGVVGELAEAVARKLIVVVAARRAELEIAEQRGADFVAGAPVVAVALAVGIDQPDVVGTRARGSGLSS